MNSKLNAEKGGVLLAEYLQSEDYFRNVKGFLLDMFAFNEEYEGGFERTFEISKELFKS
jgi:hypothetical protein